jgi:hypothetical protein
MTDYSGERVDALAYAVELHKHDIEPSIQRVLRDANGMFRWLTAPIRLIVTLGPPVDQETGQPTNDEGDTMKDTSKAQLTVTGADAKDQPTNVGTDVTFTSADESIATIVTDPADGSAWVVAGIPGSTVVTGTWPDSPSGSISGTVAVDVTAGDAVSLSITLGDEVPQ